MAKRSIRRQPPITGGEYAGRDRVAAPCRGGDRGGWQVMNPAQRAVRRFDAFQQRHLPTAFVFGVMEEYPRELARPRLTEAGGRSLAAQVHQNQRRPEQHVEVCFTGEPMTEDQFLRSGGDQQRRPGGPGSANRRGR